MVNFINKNKLLATTAICAISMCANTVKAEEIDILSILNNSTTKSPDITWTTEGATSDDVEILGKYYKYIISDNPTRDKYDERKEDLTGNIVGDFIGIIGGAIGNSSSHTIGNIVGNFIGNSIIDDSEVSGGAIFNSGIIENITGDFIGNGIKGNGVYGGAIYCSGDECAIKSINSNFFGNHVTTDSRAFGGAIYYDGDDSTIEYIIGDFINNSAISTATATYSSAEGGALYNGSDSTIKAITGDFMSNSAISANSDASGGAIDNGGTISSITGDFEGNSAMGNSKIYGGAIYNSRTIEAIVGDFVGNSVMGNSEIYGGAISNGGTISSVSGDFVDNRAIGDFNVHGGAIYNKGTITLVADASNSNIKNDILYKGNYIQVADEDIMYEAIYNIYRISTLGSLRYYDSNLNFKTQNNSSYTFYDFINGEIYHNTRNDKYYGGIINFTGDGTGTFNLYNNIQNQKDINFQAKYVFNMISPDDIHAGTSKYSYIQAQSININAALQMMLDVDLKAKEMDRFEADNFTVADGGSIDVTKFNIVTDVTGDIGTTTEVDFIVSDNVTGLDKITNVTEAVGEVYTYTVTFNPDTGAFEFVSTGLAPEPVEPSTPAPEEVAPNQAPSLTTTTTVTTVETVVAQIFDRDVTISADTNYGADTTDYMETSDGVNVTNDKSVWIKTFGSDDDVEIDNFNGTIDSEAYGIVGGVDSKVFTYDNGVKAAYGIYGAYVGGKQKYDDNKITQDSGYLGVSAAFRKSNLFSNFTLNGGYVTSESNTELGKDEFDTKVVSVANKTGFDIKAGNNWTITPAMYVAYTGMDTEDYTNKAGVKMENEFSNVVTLAPELKVRKGFNNGVGAYAKASYKHYIYDSEVKADDVVLEEMSAKPYVEYGFGVEKNWADKSGYAELTRRDGGREGWNVNLGLNLDF